MKAICIKLFDLIVGLALFYSGMIHLGNPYFFLESVARYGLVGIYATPMVSTAVIVSSLVIGSGLILGWFPVATRILAAIIFMTFIVAQSYAILSGLQIGCGCFGVETESVGFFTFFRSACLEFFVVFGLYFDLKNSKQSSEVTHVVA